MVWYSHLLKNFSQCIVIPTVKGFGIVITIRQTQLLERMVLKVKLTQSTTIFNQILGNHLSGLFWKEIFVLGLKFELTSKSLKAYF